MASRLVGCPYTEECGAPISYEGLEIFEKKFLNTRCPQCKRPVRLVLDDEAMRIVRAERAG